MNCAFCNRKIDIKTEWQKKSISDKIGDILKYLLIGLDIVDYDKLFGAQYFKKEKYKIRIIYYINLFVSFLILISSPLIALWTLSLLNLQSQVYSYIIGTVIILVSLSVIFLMTYFIWNLDMEANFRMIFNFNMTSINCPHCKKENKLKINFIK